MSFPDPIKTLRKAQEVLNQVHAAAKADSTRPLYHAICPGHWMNDPNGPITINNEMHVFYQEQPVENRMTQPMYWGHFITKDLVYWENLPIAFGPDYVKNDTSCWSGCCVIDPEGKPAILYTSVPSEPSEFGKSATVWLVHGSSDMLTWIKDPNNPVMTQKTHTGGLPIFEWRDPFAWKGVDGYYYCVMGGHIQQPTSEQPFKQNAAVSLYRSKDLISWEFCHILHSRFLGLPGKATTEIPVEDDLNLGSNYECPLFFPIPKGDKGTEPGEKYCAVVSTWPVAYALGEFKDTNFTPKMWHPIDYGKKFYAPNSFVDSQGRRILIGWALVKGEPNWAGCFSIPRILTEGPNSTLLIDPIPELAQLREQNISFSNIMIQPNQSMELLKTGKEIPQFKNAIQKGTIELQIELELPKDPNKQVEFDLQFLADSDNGDTFAHTLGYEPDEHLLFLGMNNGRFLRLPDEKTLKITIYIDRVLTEIFINRRYCFTADIPFTATSELLMCLKARDEPLHVLKLEAFSLKSINM